MPTYSYICDACGGSFEIEQRIIEDPLKTCSLCGEPKARRQITSGNFILKGGGWYSDGYGSSKAKTSSAKAETETTPSTKSDSKTEGSGGSAPTSTPSTPTTSTTPATPSKTESKASAAE